MDLRRSAARSGATLLVLLAVFGLTRALVRALPGDPIETLVAESGTSIPVRELREELGLDRPFLLAAGQDLSRALHGDFGRSLISGRPVAQTLSVRLAATAELACAAFVLSLAASLWLGLAAAANPGGAADRICTLVGALTAALPTPWIGPMLFIAFALWIPIFPSGGHLALPALTLTIAHTGIWARLFRERVGETLAQPAAVAARARGLREFVIVIKYGLAPASGALAAYLGTQLGALFAGAFVVEVIFDWKGLGTLLVDAVLKRDYPVVEAATFVAAAACLAGNRLGDLFQDLVQARRGEPDRGPG